MNTPMIMQDSQSQLLSRMMELSQERHRVLSQNLANVNTPGYIRQDLEFKATLSALLDSQGVQKTATELKGEIVSDETDPARTDGNNVINSREFGEIMQNGLFHNLLSRAFNTRLNIMRQAIRSS